MNLLDVTLDLFSNLVNGEVSFVDLMNKKINNANLSESDKTKVKDSIKSILEEAKRQELKQQEKTETNLDKSFFTSSLSFNEDDFEQMEELKKSVKHNNTLLRILLFIIVLIIAVAIVLLIFNILK